MKFAIALFGISAVAAVSYAALTPIIPSTTLVRAPHYDSAIIHSDRVGGNFAYSTVEGHAYQAITPIVQSELRPVQVRYDISAAPLAIPAQQHYYVQHPFLTPFAPAHTIQFAQEAAKIEDSKPIEEGAKNEDDTVSVEAA